MKTTLKVGDVLYSKNRNGFIQIKEINDTTAVVSCPCRFYDDATTTIRRAELSLFILNKMLVVTRDMLPTLSFVKQDEYVRAYRIKSKEERSPYPTEYQNSWTEDNDQRYYN